MAEPKTWFQLIIDCRGQEFSAKRGAGFTSGILKVLEQVAAAVRGGQYGGPITSGDGLNTLIGTWTIYTPGVEHIKPPELEREFRIYINCDGEPFSETEARAETIARMLLTELRSKILGGKWAGAFIHEGRHTFGNWHTKWSEDAPAAPKR